MSAFLFRRLGRGFYPTAVMDLDGIVCGADSGTAFFLPLRDCLLQLGDPGQKGGFAVTEQPGGTAFYVIAFSKHKNRTMYFDFGHKH